jgi:hypothetical protein
MYDGWFEVRCAIGSFITIFTILTELLWRGDEVGVVRGDIFQIDQRFECTVGKCEKVDRFVIEPAKERFGKAC